MKILIVTYYYDPYNIIATRRPVSWAKYLSRNNKVTVLTRSWTGTENGLSDIIIDNSDESIEEVNANLIVHKVPFVKQDRTGHTNTKRVSKIKGLYDWYFGKFSDVPNIRENFEHHIYRILDAESFDLVIYSCNPFIFLNIAKEVFIKTRVKYAIDFRDLISNLMLKKKVKPLENLYKKVMSLRLHFLLNKASAIISVSDPIKKIIEKFTNKPVFTIYNGFDESFFTTLNAIAEDDQIFRIIYTGNINPDTDISPLMEGISLFFEELKPNALLTFVGARDVDALRLKPYENRVNIKKIRWLPYEESLKLAKKSSVLLSIGYPGYTGILSGKIFDYLGLRRTIVLAPSNNDALEKLIIDTNSGHIATTSEEVCKIFKDLYLDWKKNGFLPFNGNTYKLEEFSRERQADKVEEILKSLFLPKSIN